MLQGWLLLEHPQLGPLARPQRFADGAESGAESGAWRPGPALCDAAAEGRLEDLRRMLGMLGWPQKMANLQRMKIQEYPGF